MLESASAKYAEGAPLASVEPPPPWAIGTLRNTVFSAVHYPERNSSRGQYAGDLTPWFTVEGGANKACILAGSCRRLEPQA